MSEDESISEKELFGKSIIDRMHTQHPSDVKYLSHGVAAVSSQERIVVYYYKMDAIKTVASYVSSILFALIAAAMIIFAPDQRGTVAEVAEAALVVTAAGIAGFTGVRAKGPGFDVNAERRRGSN